MRHHARQPNRQAVVAADVGVRLAPGGREAVSAARTDAVLSAVLLTVGDAVSQRRCFDGGELVGQRLAVHDLSARRMHAPCLLLRRSELLHEPVTRREQGARHVVGGAA